jgi:hypothetical protein
VADIVYFEDGFVESGYTVKTAYASASLQSTAVNGGGFNLSADATVYTSADLTGYVFPDYWDAGYVSSVKYASATLSASNAILAYGEDWTLVSSSLQVAASLNVATEIHKYGVVDAQSTSSLTANIERQRFASTTVDSQTTVSAQGDNFWYSGATVTATATLDVTVERQRRGQAQNLNVNITQDAQGNAEYHGSSSLSNAIIPYINADLNVGLISNPITWDETGVTWGTYPGDVWGANTYRVTARSTLSVNGGRQPGLATESFEARATVAVSNTKVGQTKLFSATLSSAFSVDVEYSRHRNNTSSFDVSADVQSDADFIWSPTILLDAAEAEISKASAIFEVSASAHLEAQTGIRILASGEAYMFPVATLTATPSRKRSSPATLAAEVTTSFDGIVGHTELASTTLNANSDCNARGNAIFGGNGDFDGIASSLAYGRVLGFDPARQYSVDAELRYIRVLPETHIYTVESVNPVNTVIEETRGIIVPQETRYTRTTTSTFEQRRELA